MNDVQKIIDGLQAWRDGSRAIGRLEGPIDLMIDPDAARAGHETCDNALELAAALHDMGDRIERHAERLRIVLDRLEDELYLMAQSIREE